MYTTLNHLGENMPEQNFTSLIQAHPTEATVVIVVLALILYSTLKSVLGSTNTSTKNIPVKEDIFGRKTIDVESEIIDNDKKEDVVDTTHMQEEPLLIEGKELIDGSENENIIDVSGEIHESEKEISENPTTVKETDTYENEVDSDLQKNEEVRQEEKEGKIFQQPKVEINLFSRGLKKSRGFLAQVLPSIFGADIDEDLMEEFEDALIMADVGPEITDDILDLVRKTAQNGGDIQSALREELLGRLAVDIPLKAYSSPQKPHVIMVVGVNGSGKTTTIGKLAYRFVQEGRKVLLAPGDTFRAGAVAQLKTWSERSGADFVDAKQDSDAASVIYSAIERAQKQNYDVVICDTAGRLQAQTTLMDELAKIVRVSKKLIPEAPHETILVLDSTIGQNALLQAKGFNEVADLTGVALTKLDGSAKGGVVIAVRDSLQLPIQLIGLGESMEALQDFHREPFVDALLQEEET